MSGSSDLYPAPTGPYRLCTKNSVPWRSVDHLRIRISVGKENSEGDKLFAFCEWAAARFARVSFIIGDTLNRHNIAAETGVGMDETTDRARALGDAWLARNARSLSLVPGAAIVRWDEGLSDERFLPARLRLDAMAMAGGTFTKELEATIAAFWLRNGEQADALRRRQLEAASRAFLIEELAVFTYQCLEHGIDAYAGSWMEGIFDVLRRDPDPFFDAFRKDWLQVDFRRNKGFVADMPMAA